MSSLPEPTPVPPSSEVCPLCGAPVAASDARCRECNMTLAGVGGRPAAFTRQSVWFWAAALLVIYLVVLAIVAAAR
jgi:predicted nucleic acid-binding Zn ribbon protein